MQPGIFRGKDIECVLQIEATVGESPVWSVREQALYWVDILGKKVHRYHPDTGHNESFDLSEEVTCAALRERGRLVLTLRKNFAYFDPATGSLDILMAPEGEAPENRFNDGKVDRQGRFWAGSMNDSSWDAATGNLYRLDPDKSLTRVWGSVACTNGLGWSPDDRVLYFGESFRYAIFAYDFDGATGQISNRRVFASIDHSNGAFPDGLTVDAEGGVWSVHNAVGRVVRYDPAGRVTAVIDMPLPQPTSVMFGGTKLDTLYITTSRQNLSASQLAAFPLSGSLFAVRPGVVGLPEASFAG
ncbi:MAG: SMP-30/gluconolactonase/LRE family protein [Gemmatimonas sp.]|nr:SMP-30/gluconolactonase/LRE family protein [Gemmatimonas sp.]